MVPEMLQETRLKTTDQWYPCDEAKAMNAPTIACGHHPRRIYGATVTERKGKEPAGMPGFQKRPSELVCGTVVAATS